MIKRSIEVTTLFEAYHCWPEAPYEVEFLANPHRHMFHVKLRLRVEHDDRELEFIMVQRVLKSIINTEILKDGRSNIGSMSCEMIASAILLKIGAKYGKRECSVSVMEDGENGAVVEYYPD